MTTPRLPANGTTNKVYLSGWLLISRVERVAVAGRTEYVAHARCHLEKPVRKGKKWVSSESYPVILTGVPARIAIRWQKVKQAPFKVALDGHLMPAPGDSVSVQIRYLDVLEFTTGSLGSLGGAASGQ